MRKQNYSFYVSNEDFAVHVPLICKQTMHGKQHLHIQSECLVTDFKDASIDILYTLARYYITKKFCKSY